MACRECFDICKVCRVFILVRYQATKLSVYSLQMQKKGLAVPEYTATYHMKLLQFKLITKMYCLQILNVNTY